MTKLEKLTKDLGEAYDAYKAAERTFAGEDKKKKNRQTGLKEEFFDGATELVAKSTLAQKTVVVPEGIEDQESWAARRNPRWKVLEVENNRVLLEEDPRFKPFTYVNRKTKRVWTRSVRDGSLLLDDNELQERDLDLWKRVTQLVNYDFVCEVLFHANVHASDIDEFIDKIEVFCPAERALVPFENMSPDDLADVQEYMYPGSPVVSLSSPRKAKPEELNE